MSSGFPSLSFSFSFCRRRRRRRSLEFFCILVDLHFTVEDPRERFRHRPFLRRFLFTECR